MGTVYLNGEFLPKAEARVSVDDRGFLLADGIYEVSAAYRGRFFRLGRHLDRMRFGLRELKIGYDPSPLVEVHEQLLRRNDLEGAEVSTVYVQITRGVANRTHHFPAPPLPPTVYAFAARYVRPPREEWEKGYRAIMVPDRRWSRVDIKSIALLPNVLAQQAAVEAGAKDALLVKDGVALEGSHNNVFAVFGKTVVTHPASNAILHGITREYVLELARSLGFPVHERAIQVEDLLGASEVFFTGTTTEIRPTVELDGRSVGDGRVGPVSRALYEAFLEGVSNLS